MKLRLSKTDIVRQFVEKFTLIDKVRRNGTIGILYGLIIFCTSLLTTLGGFRQGVTPLFLSGVAITVALIYLRNSSRVIRVNIVAIALIFIAFAYGLELYLAHFSKENIIINNWVKYGFDTRNNTRVYYDLKLEGKHPVLATTPRILLKEKAVPEIENDNIFPLGGISRRLTVLCNETGRWAIYHSDEHGFNNPLGLYREGIDLLLIGDSFTHGYCVEQDQTIAANLRKSFPSTISLGSGGNGELTRLASLIEYGSFLKPKVVLWIYTENTLDRLWSELSNPILRSYYEIDGFNQLLFKKQSIIDRTLEQFLSRRIDREPKRTDGFDALSFAKLTNLRKALQDALNELQAKLPRSTSSDEIEAARKILLKASKATASWGGKFYFVYLGQQAKRKGYEISDHDTVIELARDLGLSTIDSYHAIEKADPLAIISYNGFGHFNAEGYKLFSSIVVDALSVSR